MRKAARRFRCAGAELGGELGQQRPQRNPAILLHFREMVAVDDRQRADSAADPGISSARFAGLRASAMDVEQRGDDLEVVLHAVMDFADQPALALERAGSSRVRIHRRATMARAKASRSSWISVDGPSLRGSSSGRLARLICDDRASPVASAAGSAGG